MAEKQKVVIVGSAHPLRGGLASYNERLAKAYQEQGYDVVIYTFSLQYPSILFPGKSQYSSEPAPQNLSIKVLVNSINPFTWLKVGREIKRMKPHLVIIKFWIPFMAPCLGTIARIARKNKTTRVISIIDNIIPHEKRIGDRMLSNYWVKSVDGFVAMSHSVLDDLNTFDKNRPKKFCPHPLYDNFGEIMPRQLATEKLGLDPKFNYILFFGFIRDYKGLDWLLQAFADERLAQMPIKLLVAGEFYSDSKPYLDLIEQLNLKNRIILATDFIPDSKVSTYFCAADLVVQPYKNATQSGVTQIAYQFEKPMIVTNVGGLAEIVPNNKVGYVVEPNPKAIADGIYTFFAEQKSDEFVQNTKEEKKKYMWERMIETIDSLLK